MNEGTRHSQISPKLRAHRHTPQKQHKHTHPVIVINPGFNGSADRELAEFAFCCAMSSLVLFLFCLSYLLSYLVSCLVLSCLAFLIFVVNVVAPRTGTPHTHKHKYTNTHTRIHAHTTKTQIKEQETSKSTGCDLPTKSVVAAMKSRHCERGHVCVQKNDIFDLG
jgi:hypothetical protein